MIKREACPQCGSRQYKRNGRIHTGKQNHKCKACGRAFVLVPENRVITEEQRAVMVEEQLTFEPGLETRHRKRLRPNPLAPWELRIGALRAFYDIYTDMSEVRIVAVGRKRGNKLFIADQEFLL